MDEKMTVEQVLTVTNDLLGNIWLPVHMQEQAQQIAGARQNIQLVLDAFAQNRTQHAQDAIEHEEEPEPEAEVEELHNGNAYAE